MLNHSLIFIFISILFCGCQNNQTPKDNISTAANNVKQAAATPNPNACSNIKTHFFSSETAVDTFKILAADITNDNAQVLFQVVNWEGKVIYADTFDTKALIVPEFETLDTHEKKVDAIKKRIDGFFMEQRFTQPALAADEIFQEDFNVKEIFDEFKADPKAIGFFYLINQESGMTIGYSKKKKKVVMVATCC